MNKRLTEKPRSQPLRSVAAPLLATALATAASGCVQTDVVGVEVAPEEDPPADGGESEEPEAVGLPEEVGVPPEESDGGEPGEVDG